MTDAHLDPAAIMAEHHNSNGICSVCLLAGTGPFSWPCLPYRLAAEVATLRGQVQGDGLAKVVQESARQDAKWGEQNHPDGTGPEVECVIDELMGWATVFGYAKKRADDRAEDGRLTWADILFEEVAEAMAEDDPNLLRDELLQVSAVAVAWVQAIDRRVALDDPTEPEQVCDCGDPDCLSADHAAATEPGQVQG